MAAAAEADGISLRLVAGYEDAAATQAEFEAWEQKYLAEGLSEEEADARAATVAARPGTNEHETGLAADILADDYLTKDTGFADTEAFAWLRAYAADYGFILRYPEQRQSVTGVVYEPWHWRYVGVENARAITASGVSLEEFIALQTQG
jgi:D-alanyl-D-alanine carboxypeptidase